MLKSRSLWFIRPREIEFREEEVRPPQGDEILLETLYSGVSHGTEMLVYRGEVPKELELDPSLKTMRGSFRFPIKYGYSSVGRVTQFGPEASRFKSGDTVFVHNPHETRYVVSENLAVKLPEELPPILGIFTANLEAALNCVLDSEIRLGEAVAIFGQGVVGLLITQLLRRCGVDKIFTVDRVEKRRALSQEVGADFTLDPDKDNPPLQIRELTAGVGADVVIEASGSPEALDLAIKSVAFQGLVVVVSWYGTKPVTLHLGEEFHRQRVRLKSSQVSYIDPALTPRWNTKRRMDLVLRLLSQCHLTELISHICSFEEAQDAYGKIDRNPEEALQVVFKYV